MGMEVREKVVVPLGYGKYVRSDKIVGMEPIEDERGPAAGHGSISKESRHR